MNFKTILVFVAIAALAYYMYTHRGPSSSSPAPGKGTASGAAGPSNSGCLSLAERANSELHNASMMLLRPPVDTEAWRTAEGNVSSAISAAESACSGGSSERERQSSEEVRAALSTMRTLLSEFSSAAQGSGGATSAVQRQEEIDAHLDKARTLSRG